MRSRLARSLGIIALLALFGLMFWIASTVASSLPGLVGLAVNVHGLGLASYATDSGQRPAPVSLQLLEDVAGDSTGSRAARQPTPAVPAPKPRPTPAPTPLLVTTPKPTPLPIATPTPTPLPVATPTPTPVPSPTPRPIPVPTPTPTPTPTLLPLPVALPTLSSGLSGVLN